MPPVVQIDIFSKDVILIPINHSNAHWTAAAINFRKKRIESYDSMGMARSEVFKLLRQYLDDEHRNKKKKPFDFTGWEDYILPVRLLRTSSDRPAVLTRSRAGYPSARERLRLRRLHLPVPRVVVARRRELCLHPGEHALPPPQDGLGNRACQASGRSIAFIYLTRVSYGRSTSLVLFCFGHASICVSYWCLPYPLAIINGLATSYSGGFFLDILMRAMSSSRRLCEKA